MIDRGITNPRKPASWRIFVPLVAGIFFFLAGCGGPPKHPTWSNATGAEQLERLMWQAILEHNWKNLEYCLAPSFIGVDARGQSFDRAGWVESWKTQQVTGFSLAEVQVQPEGPDLMITYVLRLELNSPSGVSTRNLRLVSVWQQVKARWILTVTSATAIAGT